MERLTAHFSQVDTDYIIIFHWSRQYKAKSLTNIEWRMAILHKRKWTLWAALHTGSKATKLSIFHKVTQLVL